VEVGLALGMFDIATGSPLGVDAVASQAEAAEAAGFDSVWVMDHYWLARDDRRLHAHEPLVLLAHIAARTRTIGLGTMALCQLFRPLPQLAREVASLADASGGRLVVGLGAGWHLGELDAAGVDRDRPVTRLEACVPALTALLAGERVSTDHPWLRLREASIASTGPAPPIWIAGRGDRVVGIATRMGQGWNLAWAGSDTTPVEHHLERFDAGCRAAGRDRGDLVVSLGIKCNLAERWSEASAEVGGGAEGLSRAMAVYGSMGIDHLIVAPAPMPYAHVDATQGDVAAAALTMFRGTGP
jgi:alkanesulfonate monooxygenase SsuD/methylene tetrahydromethanopterin reductase-like flavin-dependent oxidoreductase (luciferase family)